MANPANTSVINIPPPSPMLWDGNLAENWRFFKQKFQLYLQATKADKEETAYKTSILLSCIGDRALKIYNNFTYIKPEGKMVYETVIQKFEEYFNPEKNVTFERHVFFLRNQKIGEKIDAYVNELRDLSATCEFGELTDSLIKDKLVLGIADIQVKDRLLRTKDLTLTKALEVCRSAERTKIQLQEICATNPQNEDELSVNKIRKDHKKVADKTKNEQSAPWQQNRFPSSSRQQAFSTKQRSFSNTWKTSDNAPVTK